MRKKPKMHPGVGEVKGMHYAEACAAVEEKTAREVSKWKMSRWDKAVRLQTLYGYETIPEGFARLAELEEMMGIYANDTGAPERVFVDDLPMLTPGAERIAPPPYFGVSSPKPRRPWNPQSAWDPVSPNSLKSLKRAIKAKPRKKEST